VTDFAMAHLFGIDRAQANETVSLKNERFENRPLATRNDSQTRQNISQNSFLISASQKGALCAVQNSGANVVVGAVLSLQPTVSFPPKEGIDRSR
jgi:hypothetical protein